MDPKVKIIYITAFIRADDLLFSDIKNMTFSFYNGRNSSPIITKSINS